MPSNSKVSIEIIAKDLASQAFKGLSSTIASGVIQANVFSSAIDKGIGLATKSVNGLTAAFDKAIDRQAQMMAGVNQQAALLQTNVSIAKELNSTINTSIENSVGKLGLPGQLNDYTSFARDTAATTIQSIGHRDGNVVDENKLKKESTDNAIRFQSLAASNGIKPKDAANQYNEFVNNGSYNSSLFDPELKNELIKLARQRYGNENVIAALPAVQRYGLVNDAVAKVQTPERLKNISDPTKAITDTFRNYLFQAETGLLSFTRKLPKVEGTSSVVEAVGKVLKTLIGKPDGLFFVIGQTLNKFGLSRDPIEGLRDGILKVNHWLTRIRDWLKGFNSGDIKLPSYEQIQTSILNFLTGIPDKVKGFLSQFDFGAIGINLANAASKIDWGGFFSQIGTYLALLVSLILPFFNNFVTTFNWGSLLGGLFKGLGSFLANLNWGEVTKTAGIALLVFILAGTAAVGAGIIGSLGLIPILIGAAIVGVLAVVVAKWEDIKKAVGNWLQDVWTAIQNVWEIIVWNFKEQAKNAANLIQKVWIDGICNPIISLFNAIGSWVNDFKNKIPGINKSVPNIQPIQPIPLQPQKPSPPPKALTPKSDEDKDKKDSTKNVAALPTLSIGAIHINTESNDPQKHAEAVLQALASKYEQFSQSRLAPSYG